MKKILARGLLLATLFSAATIARASAFDSAYLEYMPSVPLALVVVEQDPELASLIKAGEPPGGFPGLQSLLPGASPSAEAALLKIFWDLAREPAASGLRVTAACALVRPTASFAMVPKLVLLLGTGDTTPFPIAAAAAMCTGIRLHPPNGGPEEAAVNGNPLPSVYSSYAGPYLVLSGDKELLKSFRQKPVPTAAVKDLSAIRAVWNLFPGKLRGYCNGAVSSLFSLYTDYYISEDWTEELAGFKSLGFGIMPGKNNSPNKFSLYLQGTMQEKNLLGLLGRFNLEGSAEISPDPGNPAAPAPPIALNLRLQSNWKYTYPELLAWLRWHWPRETSATMAGYRGLAEMTGIDIPRDFLRKLTGEIRVYSTYSPEKSLTGLVVGVNDPEAVRAALDRSALWSSDFAARGAAQQYFQKDGEGKWLLKGTPAGGIKYLEMKENPGGLSLAPEISLYPETLVIPPGAGGAAEPRNTAINFTMKFVRDGVLWECDWRHPGDFGKIQPALQACANSIGELLGFYPPSSASKPGAGPKKPEKSQENNLLPELR